MSDPSWKGYKHMYDEKAIDFVAEGKLGYSRVDFALSYASWIVHDAFKGGFSWKKIKGYRIPVDTVGINWTKTRHEFDDAAKASRYIKRAATLFGASLVGVCKLNRDWVYADVGVPDKFENAIVIGIEMDADGIATSPAVPALLQLGWGTQRWLLHLLALANSFGILGTKQYNVGMTLRLVFLLL